MKFLVRFLVVGLGLTAATFLRAANEPVGPPNIVFIAIDDLNDWVGCLGGNPDVKTPHMDRLAERGLLFTNAHCQVPVCMGSRVSVFSGKLASTTGCYEFNAEFHQAPTLANDLPIPLLFKRQGYHTLGGGKLLHSGFQGRLAETFDVQLSPGRNPTPKAMMNWPVKVWDFGPFPERDEEMGDHQLAAEAAEFLGQAQSKPFFLAVGFHRPHVPLHVPKPWFDLYDRDALTLPKAPIEDMDDIPESDITRQKAIAPSHAEVLKSGKWRDLVHAYLACISFVDHCVGMVADAAMEGPNAGNTVLVLWSDHGFHLGEKQHWAKRTLWAESTRAPLIFAGRGIPHGARTDAPVGLVDLYPTLCELAGVPVPEGRDGVSLRPLIDDPTADWDRAVVSTWLPNNHSIVDRDWRYIHYADGGEELYDHRNDADEFTNLASDPRFADVKKRLASWLPKQNVPLLKVPGAKAKKGE
ncbi:MAG: sulfatase [Akkermansiaceae bacterium]|nr:sulfatase [Akkermansiaceae bacterium]